MTETGTGKYERLLERCRGQAPIPTAVAWPCDETSLAGAIDAAKNGLIIPILVGPTATIAELAKAKGIDLGKTEIVDAADSHAAAAKAVALVREGKAELLMKGSLHSDEILGAVVAKEGLRAGRRLSHVFLMDVPTYHKVLDHHRRRDQHRADARGQDGHLSERDRPGALVRSRAAEGRDPRGRRDRELEDARDARCRRALQDGRARADQGRPLDGPLAFDNAISRDAAKIKGIVSEVAGDPDILLAPDLEAGNMMAKQLSFLANADSAGLVLGARVPVILTSRADSLRSRIASCAVAALGGPRAAAGAELTREAHGRLRPGAECRLVEPQVLRLPPPRRRGMAARGAGSDRRDRNHARVSAPRTTPAPRSPTRRSMRRSRTAAPRSTCSPDGSAPATPARACSASATASCTAAPNTPAPASSHPEVLDDLRGLIPLAPLHQPYNLAAIEAVSEQRPGVPQVACFDTSFHRGQPAVAELVPLPKAIRDSGVQRYGFHGLSYEYIASALPAAAPDVADGRVIVAHLGSGASLCALKARKSVDSTLGFTALDGLCMGTRPGSHRSGRHPAPLPDGRALGGRRWRSCSTSSPGLLGISGISNDMRDLLDEHRARPRAWRSTTSSTRPRSISARSPPCSGGVDALVFTAGIGERSAEIRRRICEASAWLGVTLDPTANAAHGPRISTAGQSRLGRG